MGLKFNNEKGKLRIFTHTRSLVEGMILTKYEVRSGAKASTTTIFICVNCTAPI